ncbi:MAG: hypothetical protein JWM62_1131 [Frankiales bacterium]|jgi:hypothetical protein|nr:hypothetical protein [Frankiales bacterium]
MALASLVQDLILVALPAGGQGGARQNAWASMSAGAARARSRRDADTALAAAVLRAERRQRTGS